MKQLFIILTFLLGVFSTSFGQKFNGKENTPEIGDEYILEKVVLDDGDTIFLEVLPEMVITPLRITPQEELIWQYYNKKVYNKKNDRRERFLKTRKPDFLLSSVYKRKLRKKPELYEYAAKAIHAYEDFLINTADFSDRAKNKYAKKQKKEIKKEYDPKELKSLTKMEGRLLIKLVEYSTNKSFYNILVDLRGKGKAAYWETITRTFNVGTLKEGFNVSEYPVMNKAFNQEDVAQKINTQIELIEQRAQ